MYFTIYICHSLFTVTSLHKSQYLGCYVSVVKNLPANGEDAGDEGSVPGSRRSPGEGNGNLLQYSCLENPMGRGAWWAAIYGVAKSWTWCEELTHWKGLWCWEGLGAGREGDDRGWDGWMASLTRWMWVWVNSGGWWWTGRPGMLQFMGSQRVGHDWVTELNWTEVT